MSRVKAPGWTNLEPATPDQDDSNEMRTPAGSECRYYYQDFHRGRSVQECRLLAQARETLPWKPKVCSICPVPAILRANDCQHMVLDARLVRQFLRRRVAVEAYCSRHKVDVANPYVGCGRCHPDAAAILGAGEQR